MTSGGVILLAFDYGRRRIGIALGNTLSGSVRPLETLANDTHGPDWKRIAALIDEWRPDRLVVGVPYNDAALPDAAPDSKQVNATPGGELAGEAQRFARRLNGRFGLPVDTVDERLSSAEAEARLKKERRAGWRGRITKQDIDGAAAAVILQDWLEHHT